MQGKKEKGCRNEMVLFIALCMVFLVMAGGNMKMFIGAATGQFKNNVAMMTAKEESDKTEGGEKKNFFWDFIVNGFSREMNLLNKESEEQSIDEIEEFKYDYGTYSGINSKLRVGDSKKEDVAEVFNNMFSYSYPEDKIQVLLYHTHTGEGYLDALKSGEKNISEVRDNTKNVVAVAVELKKELERYGINVITDKDVYDEIDYKNSYLYSRKGVQEKIQKAGGVDLAIDIHRDSLDEHPGQSERNKAMLTGEINNEKVAKLIFVFSDNAKNYQNDFGASNELLKIGKNLYPALFSERWNKNREKMMLGELHYNRGVHSFNQLDIKNNVLIEVGGTDNFVHEAKNSAKYIARMIAEYLYRQYTEI